MLPAAQRPAAFFLADHLALDFLNTRASPHGEEIEWLSDGPSYLEWLILGFDRRADAKFPAVKLDDVGAKARALREWFRSFVQKHAGEVLHPSDERTLQPLNEILSHDHAYQQIAAGTKDTPLLLRTQRDWTETGDLLQPVAHAIAELLCHADFTQVRRCEGLGCTMWFLDVSKSHKRRWCSMSVCGNRAKVAQHRARKREGR